MSVEVLRCLLWLALAAAIALLANSTASRSRWSTGPVIPAIPAPSVFDGIYSFDGAPQPRGVESAHPMEHTGIHSGCGDLPKDEVGASSVILFVR